MRNRLELTPLEVTNLLIVAAMLDDELVEQIQDKSVQATVLKVKAVSQVGGGFIRTPGWKLR